VRPVAAASSAPPASATRGLDESLSPDAVPTLLTIPALGIKAPIVVTGTDPDGVPETPPFDRPDEVGWYGRTVSPGSEGASVIWATFTVERLATYPDDNFPSDLVYDDPGYPALRLITCGGAFDRKSRAYLSAVVVFARLTAGSPGKSN
jgi:hypothetical protein